jgi:hypothetical protein
MILAQANGQEAVQVTFSVIEKKILLKFYLENTALQFLEKYLQTKSP